VRGVKLSEGAPLGRGGTALVDALGALRALIDAVPPAPAALRYGNPAFRTWHAQAAAKAEGLLAGVLPPDRADDARVLAPMLRDALGNPSRVDYGTGHETAFVALLFCLARAGALEASDARACVTRAFAAYAALARALQTTYWLEPAGSHGVWGLDDYVFLPFYWGSAQLDGAGALSAGAPRPRDALTDRALADFGDEYLYLDAVRFVRQVGEKGGREEGLRRMTARACAHPPFPPPLSSPQVKKGPLGETSPMLCDIGAVPTWAKVGGEGGEGGGGDAVARDPDPPLSHPSPPQINAGMLRMYRVEVLGKVPIMQHFLFSYLFPFGGGA